MRNVSQNWREIMDVKQNELDMAEEFVLAKLFGNAQTPVISKKWEILLALKGIDYRQKINDYLFLFEQFAKDVQKDNGMFDGQKISHIMTIQYPQLQGLNLPDIRPIDLARFIDGMINIEKLGAYLRE